MLDISDVIPRVWVTHEETKTRYLIKPVEPKDSRRLLAASKDKKGEFDGVKYNGLAADHMIEDWEGVSANKQLTPCTSEARVKFGERFGRIVAFLMERATDPGMFGDEDDAGKNA